MTYHHHDHACVHSESSSIDPAPSSVEDEVLDEARRGTGLTRRAILTGLSAVAGAGAVATGAAPAWASAPGADAAAHGQADRAGMQLVLLGTRAGPPAMPDRTGISSAVVVDGATYVVDCGRSAVTQYMHAGLKLRNLRGIFLTHLHADHVVDYYNFFLTGGHIPNQFGDNIVQQVQVHGPGSAGGLPPKYGGGTAPTVSPHSPAPGTREMTARLHEAYAYSSNIFLRDMTIADPRNLAAVHEIRVPSQAASFQNTAPRMAAWEIYRDDKVRVLATLVPHGPVFPAFAFRFESEYGSITFSGDTRYSENLIDMAQDTDILVHEALDVEGASIPEADLEHMLAGHIVLTEAGPIAEAANARHLVLSHISDLAGAPIDARAWRHVAQQGYRRGRAEVGEDLKKFVVPS